MSIILLFSKPFEEFLLSVSLTLRVVYLAYMLFQLWSHTYLYNDKHNKKSNRLSTVLKEQRAIRKNCPYTGQRTPQCSSTEVNRISSESSSLSLDPPRRPFASSPLSSTSDVTLSSRSGSSFEKEPYSPPGISTVRLVAPAPDMGGVPMRRNSTVSTVSLACSSTISVDTTAVAIEEPPAPPPPKEPELSWFLTIFLLIVVTGVRPIWNFVIQS